MEYALPIDVPEDVVVKASITIVSFFDADGNVGYRIKVHGGEPMTSYLGLLVVAQRDIMTWSDND